MVYFLWVFSITSGLSYPKKHLIDPLQYHAYFIFIIQYIGNFAFVNSFLETFDLPLFASGYIEFFEKTDYLVYIFITV